MMNPRAAVPLSLTDLLAVEDDAALTEILCPSSGLPLWTQVRIAFFRTFMSEALYGRPITGRSVSPPPRARAITTLVRSVLHNAGLAAIGSDIARILITADGVANQMVDGRWFNRLVDYFGQVSPDTTILEDHFEWRWPFPRHHTKVMFHAPRQVANAVLGRSLVRASHVARARALIDLVAERARRTVGWTMQSRDRAHLVAMLARKSASMPSQFEAYRRLLNRIRPSILLVGAGCYGPNAGLIAAAKDAGISTGEYQHGAVSAGHDAYNFAAAIRDSPVYKRALPEAFLSYGAWWTEQINAPLQMITVGNPHRERRLSELRARADNVKYVLLLSDGIDFDVYLTLASQLAAPLASLGLHLQLRPHPLERSFAHEHLKGKSLPFGIDEQEDLYVSLFGSHAVVSEVSTGLFEAVGVTPRIFIWATPKSSFAYPSHPFQEFTTVGELCDLLADSDAGRVSAYDADRVWASGWERRYLDFVGKRIGTPTPRK